MKLHIEIELDNAAFEPDSMAEIKRILDYVTYHVTLRHDTDKPLRDINGNVVGRAWTEEG
jgi:hypothetical protein